MRTWRRLILKVIHDPHVPWHITVTVLLVLAFVFTCVGCKSNGPPAEPENKASPGSRSTPRENDVQVFDPDYDDSWVTSVPEVIAGYRVIEIYTPKNRACTGEPLLTLHTPPGYVSGTLDEIFATMEAIPEVPSNIRLSMSYTGAKPEQMAARQQELKEWNEARMRHGCPKAGTLIALPD